MKLHLFIALVIAVGCTKKDDDSSDGNTTSDGVISSGEEQGEFLYPVDFSSSFQLQDFWLTYKDSTTVVVDCGNSPEYAISSTENPSEPTEWLECSAGSFNVSVSLSDGENHISLWFRKNEVVEQVSLGVLTKQDFLTIENPDPQINDEFGGLSSTGATSYNSFRSLPNGDLIVCKHNASTNSLTHNGMVQILDGRTLQTKKTFHGEVDQLSLCRTGVTVLHNENIVIRSEGDNNSTTDPFSVKVIDGQTYEELSNYSGTVDTSPGFSTSYIIAEDDKDHFIVRYVHAEAGGFDQAGKILFFDNTTGALLMELSGTKGDQDLGAKAPKYVGDNHYLILDCKADAAGPITSAGRVALVDIDENNMEWEYFGTYASDNLCNGTSLSNGNFVVYSSSADTVAFSNAGTAILLNNTGGFIQRIDGDQDDDELGYDGVIALPSGHYLIVSHRDNEGATLDTGSIRMMDGTTGLAINEWKGDNANENFGTVDPVVLPNGNFVIAVPLDHNNSRIDNGFVALVNGSTGAELATFVGDQTGNQLGSKIHVSQKGVPIIMSYRDDTVSLVDNGSVFAIDPDNGSELWKTEGEHAGMNLGDTAILSAVRDYGSHNLVFGGDYADSDTLTNAGVVTLMNLDTGAVIQNFWGERDDDRFAWLTHRILSNENIVVGGRYDDTTSTSNVGAIAIIDTQSNTILNKVYGENGNDYSSFDIHELENNLVAVAAKNHDVGGNSDAGLVNIYDSTTGEIIRSFSGDYVNSRLSSILSYNAKYGYIVLGDPMYDPGTTTASGRLYVVPIR